MGPDSKFSLEPEEFSSMVNSVRTLETAMGKVSYELDDATRASCDFSRSLFVVKDVKKENISVKITSNYKTRIWTSSQVFKRYFR